MLSRYDLEKYQEISELLEDLWKLGEVDPQAELVGQRLLVAMIVKGSVPPEKVWNHSPDSVVFEWSYGKEAALMLTASYGMLSFCLSRPEGVLQRCEQKIGDSTAEALDHLIKLFIEKEQRQPLCHT